jgi:hypothetical protein
VLFPMICPEIEKIEYLLEQDIRQRYA